MFDLRLIRKLTPRALSDIEKSNEFMFQVCNC